MKRIIAAILGTVILLSGCKGGDSIRTPNHSSKSVSVSSSLETNAFEEEDICAKLLNCRDNASVQTTSNTAYADGKNYYISFLWANDSFEYDARGNKKALYIGAYNYFIKDDITYYEEWGGATDTLSNLVMVKSGKPTTLFKECSFIYGKSGIYVKPDDKEKLYRIEYGDTKLNEIKISPELHFDAEYENSLWFLGDDGLYKSDIGGNNCKLFTDDISYGEGMLVGFRNHFVYILDKDNVFKKYSVENGDCSVLPNPFDYPSRAYNFTNNHFLIAGDGGLYSYDSNFKNKKQIMSDVVVYLVSSINNTILVEYHNKSDKDLEENRFARIDENGNLLQTFK